jgi:cold shock CspA family protein
MFRKVNSTLLSLYRPTILLQISYGVVRQWAEGSRFGFIRDDDSLESIFTHRANCVWANNPETHRSITVGTRVAYDIKFDSKRADGSRRCENVTLENGDPLPQGPWRDSDAGGNNNSSGGGGGGGNERKNKNNNNHSSSSSSDSQDGGEGKSGKKESRSTNNDILKSLIGKKDLVGKIRSMNQSFGFIEFFIPTGGRSDDETSSSGDIVSSDGSTLKRLSIFVHVRDVISETNSSDLSRRARSTLKFGDEVVFDVVAEDRKDSPAKAANVSKKMKPKDVKKPVYDGDGFGSKLKKHKDQYNNHNNNVDDDF